MDVRKNEIESGWGNLVAGFLLFVFTAACMICHTDSPWSKILPFTDSDVFLYGGWAMHRGEVLYVDFFDHKGPYLYFLQWLGWGLTHSHVGVWIIELLFVYSAVLASYIMVRKKVRNKAACICVVFVGYWYLSCYLCFGNYTEAYVLPMISISALIFSSYFINAQQDLHWGQCILLGILFASAILIRPNSIAIWIIFCFVITLQSLVQKRYRNVGKYMTGFLIGMGVACLPLVIYLTKEKAWTGFVEFFLFNFKYVEASGNKMDAVKHFFCTPVSILTFLGIVLECVDKWRKKQFCLWSICILCWFLLGLYFTCMAGAVWNHYGCMLLPIFPIGIASFIHVLKCSIYEIEHKKAVNISAMISFCIGIFITVNLYDSIGNLGFIKAYTWILVDSPSNDLEVKVLSEKIREKTKETDRISVFGNACKYYLEAQRLSASKWIYQNPLYHIDKKIGEKYVNDLINNPPSAIVVQDKTVFEDSKDEIAQKVKFFLDDNYSCDYNGGRIQLFFLEDNVVVQPSDYTHER